MIKAITVDDEACFREMIQVLLADYFPDINVVAQAESVEEAVQAIEEYQPELVFLDIEIKGGTGFHVLQKLKNHDFKLIFVTAYNEFAIQAIKFSAIDYILKPINQFEFKSGVERAISELDRKAANFLTENLLHNYRELKDKKLVLTTLQEIHVVSIAEIVRCTSDNSYTTFYLDSGEKILVSKGICDYAELLREFGFIRPHQSHLVNLNFIKKLDKSEGGCLILKDKSSIPVSTRKMPQIMEVLNKL